MQRNLVHCLEFSISLRLWRCQLTVFVSLPATDHFKQRMFIQELTSYLVKVVLPRQEPAVWGFRIQA